MKLDFIRSYRSPVTEFDRETYDITTAKGRKLRKVEIYFGIIFMLAGLLHYLIFIPFSDADSPQTPVLFFFVLLGIVMITLRSTSLFRMQRIPDPSLASPKSKQPRYTYAYFANRKPPRPTSAVPLD